MLHSKKLYQKRNKTKPRAFDNKRYFKVSLYRKCFCDKFMKTKKGHFRTFFQENYDNMKDVSSKINESIKHNNRKFEEIIITENSFNVTIQKDIENKFNNYFIRRS